MIFQIVVNASPLDAVMPSGASSASLIGMAIVGFLLIVVVVLGVKRLVRVIRRPELDGTNPEKIRRAWQQIEQTSGQGIMGSKLALIEADKLLDTVLRAMYMPGETLADRLKSARYKYPNINKVWWAHKLRNQLVHDTTFEITSGQVRSALNDYKNALKTLNVF